MKKILMALVLTLALTIPSVSINIGALSSDDVSMFIENPTATVLGSDLDANYTTQYFTDNIDGFCKAEQTNTTIHLVIDGVTIIDNGTLVGDLVCIQSSSDYIIRDSGTSNMIIRFYANGNILPLDDYTISGVSGTFGATYTIEIYPLGYTAPPPPSILTEIFEGISGIVLGASVVVTSLFANDGAVSILYTSEEGLSLLGYLIVLVFGFGIVRWAFNYLVALIRMRA